MGSLHAYRSAEAAAERVISEGERQIADEHRKHIEAEQAKRQRELDERARLKRESEARKEKRRIKKMRKNLALQRQDDCVKFDELMERHE